VRPGRSGTRATGPREVARLRTLLASADAAIAALQVANAALRAELERLRAQKVADSDR